MSTSAEARGDYRVFGLAPTGAMARLRAPARDGIVVIGHKLLAIPEAVPKNVEDAPSGGGRQQRPEANRLKGFELPQSMRAEAHLSGH
jgi:hypothetical protein